LQLPWAASIFEPACVRWTAARRIRPPLCRPGRDCETAGGGVRNEYCRTDLPANCPPKGSTSRTVARSGAGSRRAALAPCLRVAKLLPAVLVSFGHSAPLRWSGDSGTGGRSGFVEACVVLSVGLFGRLGFEAGRRSTRDRAWVPGRLRSLGLFSVHALLFRFLLFISLFFCISGGFFRGAVCSSRGC